MLTHADKVEKQFGNAAEAYLASNVHRRGPDLLAFKEILGDHRDARLLDLGCGAGHLSYAAAELVREVVAYDLSSEMLNIVETESQKRSLRHLSVIQGHAEALPFEDASFDLVCTRYSAHHWTDIQGALRETRRVLKPNGLLVVMDVCASDVSLFDMHLQTIELLRDSSHVRDYTVVEWRRFLEDAGFSIGELSTWKIDIDFNTWVKRMSTQPVFIDAILALLQNSSREVRDYLRVLEDGSFTMDSMLMTATVSSSGR